MAYTPVFLSFLDIKTCRGGGIGIRVGLKNRSSYEVVGSTPTFGMNLGLQLCQALDKGFRPCVQKFDAHFVAVRLPRNLLDSFHPSNAALH